ncbi:non-canonical purine NTP pyrophosphatase [Fructobacillus pseudoficulneus]|uniref:dITP/XTP pyrophosphatase n=1 Tax=Fructobacillus pseudoficulneus TaxID=220714 RepID=A0A3F3H8Z4_9LACO|nr:XTP/dITP diphosphatase [Fructobacillus pseudoficulneus]GAP02783.1 non-canonical purine NTP pyrophosphatase [Fructobacillus pseudoficulneus]SEH39870.1 XTP/dITP diphosphohydrolase [Fructobacillus pseudoficulneus]
MPRLIIATGNAHKVVEIKEALDQAKIDLQVLSLKDLDQVPEIVEDGTTFAENVHKKTAALQSVYPADYILADDSGLTIPALGGEPGVYSARYAGDHDDAANNAKVLTKLAGKSGTERQAHFTTVMELIGPGREDLVVSGQVDGLITEEPAGDNLFGYDPIFYYEPAGKTFAQMTVDEKNHVSHRGRALEQLVAAMPIWLNK